MPDATHAYVARYACGHAFGLVVDCADKDTRSSLTEFLSVKGAYVDRVTLEVARQTKLRPEGHPRGACEEAGNV